jgi:endonuclease/exonuclease/phosphatase family metal-dependent hydrolase
MDKMLTLGTFNVRWADPNDGEHRWGLRKDRLMALLREWGPDVLGLQEPLLPQLDAIRQALPEYESVAVGRNDGMEAGEFCPVFYRAARFERLEEGAFWFSETPDTPGSMGWGSRHPRLCTWVQLKERESSQAFFVYNLHWDHESQEAREHSALILLDRIRKRSAAAPVIVLGDFNAEADNPAVARLSGPLSPVPLSVLTPEQRRQSGTFHGFTGETAETPIDHIFVSPEWKVVEAKVLRGDGKRPFLSDHFPLASTLHLISSELTSFEASA